jgi:hypothetical protein
MWPELLSWSSETRCHPPTHAMHDDRQPSRHSDDRALHATMPRNLHAQALSHDHLRLWVIRTRAASNNVSRIRASPHFEMPLIRSISPDCCRHGQAEDGTDRLRVAEAGGTSTVARKLSATTGPTPGVVISLRQTSSWHTISTIIFGFDLQKAQLFERALRRGGIAEADEKGPPM